MRRLIKNISLIALGLTLGCAFSTFASVEKIQAYRDNVTSIFINGNALKSDDLPISYKNKLYVPLRTISENMDMEVQYDKANKSVMITKKPDLKADELARQAKLYEEAQAQIKTLKAQNAEEARKIDTKISSVEYKDLPVSYRDGKFYMTLKMVVRTNASSNSEFYFDVKNEDEIGYVVDPFSVKLNYVNGKIEGVLDTDEVLIADMDKRTLSSIDTNYDDTLYFTLKEIPEGIHHGTLSYNIYKVGEQNNIKKVIMPINF